MRRVVKKAGRVIVPFDWSDQVVPMGEKLYIGKTDGHTHVDGNNDFVHPKGSLFVSGLPHEVSSETFVANTLQLWGLPFGYRITTEDCHVKDHIEFRTLNIVHCLINTWGQKYFEQFQCMRERADTRIIKGMDLEIMSFSITSSPQFHYLIAQLRALGIKRIFISGLALNYCVIEAAIAFAIQGFEVYIVRDATRSVPHPIGEEEEYIKHRMRGYRIKFVNLDQLLPPA